jgi:primase-polymerase (primpol)-like protein
MIQESTAVHPPIIENIPEELKARPQWVCWRLEEREGTQTKMLYIPGTPTRAKSNDLMTWRTFSEALAAYASPEQPAYDGIGYVFGPCPFAGIDLDDCRDPETGDIAEWAQEIIGSVSDEAYIEVSPSGTGVHVIVEGKVRGGGLKRGSVEMYSQSHFFTVTGDVL